MTEGQGNIRKCPLISESHEAGMGKAQIRNNMIRFVVAQAFGSANSVIVYATGAIVGDMLAPNKALATFPISVFVVGMAACTLPMGAIARRWGRQGGIPHRHHGRMTSGLIAALAVLLGSFWLFSAAMFLVALMRRRCCRSASRRPMSFLKSSGRARFPL